MKIAFVSPYPPSKVTLNEYGYHLIRAFIGKPGVEEIFVITDHLENDEDYNQYKTEGITLIPSWKFDKFSTSFDIASTLRKLKPDVVIYNLQFMSFGESKVTAALGLFSPWISRLQGYKTIVLLHNITETVNLETIGMSKNKLGTMAFKFIGTVLTRLLLQAHLVGLTIGKYVDIIKNKYKVNNVTLLPHGNFEVPQREYLPEVIEEYKLLAFGKFGTYKKVEVLIDAMIILEKQYPNLRFKSIIAGTDNPNVKGYLDGVQKTYSHKDNIVFTGYVREEDVERIFKESTFIIFPYTTTTGSSGILHQAGSYARACVLPNIDDLTRVVEEEGYAGEYFTPEDAPSLAAAISRLIDNPATRLEMESQNYEAAKGLPMSQLADIYLEHIKTIKQ